MDALKLIPQVFFDVIGRLVPGAFLLVCLDALIPGPLMTDFVNKVAPNDPLRQSPVVWILIVMSSAYLAGQFLAPFIRYLERAPTSSQTPDPPKPEAAEAAQQQQEQLKQQSRPPLHERMFVAIRNTLLPFRTPGTKFDDKVWLQYDWLRLEKPEAGGLVARIRAEYTMNGGFAVTLLVSFAIVVSRAVIDWSRYPGSTRQYVETGQAWSAMLLIVVSALASVVMLHRHRDTYVTFGRGVQNFYRASKDCDRWKDDFLVSETKK